MKKTTYALLFLLFLSFSVSAQLRVNTTGGYFLNAGDFNGFSVGGYALDANVRFGAKKSLQWGFGTGYYRTVIAEVSLTLPTSPQQYTSADLIQTYIPITVGFEKYLSNARLRAFTGMEAGAMLNTLLFAKNSRSNPSVEITNPSGGRPVNFTANGTFGVLYDINERVGFVAKTRYSGILYQNGGYINALTFSAGLSFVLGK
jgi:hypothetical protein